MRTARIDGSEVGYRLIYFGVEVGQKGEGRGGNFCQYVFLYIC